MSQVYDPRVFLLKMQSFPSMFLDDTSGNDEPLDFAGALIDLRNTGIPIMPLRWHLCNIAHSTQNLDRLQEGQQLAFCNGNLPKWHS